MKSKKNLAILLIILLVGLLLYGCGPTAPKVPPPTAALLLTDTPEPTPAIFNLKVNVTPEIGGSVTPNERQFEEGHEVDLYAEPAIGYAFDQWSGDDSSRNHAVTVVMDADKELTAHFERAPTLVVFNSGVSQPETSQLANALIDFDSDGDLDLVVSVHNPNFPSPVLAFRNDGNGKFVNETAEVFANYPVESTNASDWAVEDFNGDGLEDLIISDMGRDYSGAPRTGGQSRILMQIESGQLIDETKDRIPEQKAYTSDITTGDIDGDGDVDIYMGNVWGATKIGPRFYINDGAGYFTEDTGRIPRSISNLMKQYPSSLLVDVDNDDDLDLILGSYQWTAPSFQDTVLLNDGEGSFTEAPLNSLPTRLGGSSAETVSISAADFDQDGWQDLLMSTHVDRTYNANLQLLLNNGDGTFRDETSRIEQDWDSYPVLDCGTGYSSFIARTYIMDANNDGWLDILAQGSSCLMHLLFESSAGEKFTIVDNLRDYPMLGGYGPLVPGDLNGDGIMDVVLFYHGENHQVLLRVLPSDPQAGKEPVVWNLSPDEIPPPPEFTCIDETAMAEKSPEATTTFLYRDDFEGTLAPGWNWIREEEEQWSLSEKHGYLRFFPEPTFYHRNLLLRPAPEDDFEISTRMIFAPSGNRQYAGLLIYQDDDTNVKYGRGYAFYEWDPDQYPGNAIYYMNTIQGQDSCPYFETVTDSESEAYLKIRREGNLYSGYYSHDGISWTLTGQLVAELESFSIGLFGPRFVNMTTDFDYFLIETLP